MVKRSSRTSDGAFTSSSIVPFQQLLCSGAFDHKVEKTCCALTFLNAVSLCRLQLRVTSSYFITNDITINRTNISFLLSCFCLHDVDFLSCFSYSRRRSCKFFQSETEFSDYSDSTWMRYFPSLGKRLQLLVNRSVTFQFQTLTIMSCW